MAKLQCTFYGIPKDLQPYVRRKLKGFSVTMKNEPLTDQNLDKKAQVLGVFVDSPVTAKMIKALPKLKLIVTMSTGFDHVAIRTAKQKQIPVSNVPTYGENTVAEHALSLMLGLSRNLFPSVKRVKEGLYDYHGLRGFDIKGKTIGVIGTGHIGMHLVRMLNGFDAEILAYDLFPKKELEAQYHFTYATFDRLIKRSDIISLHAPLTDKTKHMIDKKVLKKMKKGAYIINTSRGGLIDAKALLWALDTGQIAGAGLDVLEDEGLVTNHEALLGERGDEGRMRLTLMNNMLIDHPNTIITPHNAFNSTEAVTRIMDTTVENIQAYANGTPQNDVTKK